MEINVSTYYQIFTIIARGFKKQNGKNWIFGKINRIYFIDLVKNSK